MRRPIDTCFRSLADDLRQNAVGAVLPVQWFVTVLKWLPRQVAGVHSTTQPLAAAVPGFGFPAA